MFDMVLVIQCGNVASSQGLPARVTDQVQTSEIVAFTEWMLFAIGFFDGEEL